MTIDEAIKHCLEVAEKNDGEAEVYGLLAQNHNSTYEKLTAAKFEKDCAECASDHRQLAEWLRELKEAKRLLKLAVEDFAKMDYHIYDCDGECVACPLSGERDHCLKWRYADEALKLIGEDGESK